MCGLLKRLSRGFISSWCEGTQANTLILLQWGVTWNQRLESVTGKKAWRSGRAGFSCCFHNQRSDTWSECLFRLHACDRLRVMGASHDALSLYTTVHFHRLLSLSSSPNHGRAGGSWSSRGSSDYLDFVCAILGSLPCRGDWWFDLALYK